MATSIQFPFYIKADNGQTFVKMLSPYESIEVMVTNNTALVYRISEGDKFTGSYKAYLKDEVMYSNHIEFDENFQKAVEFISPALAMHQKIHLN